MFKKVLMGVVLVGLMGVLIVGAVVRTMSVADVAEARGQGAGRGWQAEADFHEPQQAGQGYGRQAVPYESQASGQGYGRAAGLDTQTTGQGRGGRWGQSGSIEHPHGIDPLILNNTFGPAADGALSEAEIEGILYMREEEKLAHDVYLALYQKWGLPIFQNIANSEQTHTVAVQALIERYNLSDPAGDLAAGDFTNSTLQALYDQLLVEGNRSLASALRIGAAIEEIDILDLEKQVAQTGRADIQLVYDHLANGSYNHLRAFVSTLNRQTGELYQPQHLGPAAYDSIVNGVVGQPIERGRGKGRQN